MSNFDKMSAMESPITGPIRTLRRARQLDQLRSEVGWTPAVLETLKRVVDGKGTPEETNLVNEELISVGSSLTELKATIPFVELTSRLEGLNDIIGFARRHADDPDVAKMSKAKILRELRAAADTFEAGLR